MAQWALVFAFLAVLLTFAWFMDRRCKRRRLGLLAHEPGGRVDEAIARAEGIDPGISARATWMGREGQPPGGGGGMP